MDATEGGGGIAYLLGCLALALAAWRDLQPVLVALKHAVPAIADAPARAPEPFALIELC